MWLTCPGSAPPSWSRRCHSGKGWRPQGCRSTACCAVRQHPAVPDCSIALWGSQTHRDMHECTHRHVQTHTHRHIHAHTHTHAHTRSHKHTRTHNTHTLTQTHTYMHAHTLTQTHTHTNTHMHTHTHIHNTHTHAYTTHPNTHTHTHTTTTLKWNNFTQWVGVGRQLVSSLQRGFKCSLNTDLNA